MVLFGEEHGNPVSHHLENTIYSHLATQRKGGYTLSLEMLTTEQQDKVNLYASGEDCGVSAVDLLGPGGWEVSDYASLLEIARQSESRIIGANAPRRLTSLVAKSGVSALDR
uniref:Haem-binding uptake Tiki superfamily ChaN domain-containing protein n=1 Tax=Octactis speculum TaxID=3111310 RepID=A0A7S2HAB5_9STRA|mmetsp:Transcript_62817/g.86352  ORF Transcript_62817/g.86352 Transcript_62817/m.86352 type:complete len:112 (+) Transcript_62817:198-533(+)